MQIVSRPLAAVALWLIGVALSPSFAADGSGPGADANQLKDHPAPYLALHGDDPVAWQEWNAAAVERARRENKILFLSVGYFACHWCHVMQRESYQNDAVAEFLNQHFISVKVDRELEPALDDRLMSFAQRTSGRGGWPLNVFITPDGYPIHSVLYVPQPQFLQLLERLQTLWQDEPQRVLDVVRQDARADIPANDATLERARVDAVLTRSVASIMQRADTLSGGFGQQNKFPSVPQLEYLLADYRQTAREPVREFLTTTLDAMASLGLHDHLQGGFFRYTVDPTWQIPHFEKMLYDNAALARLYLHASEVLETPAYRRVATMTLDFLRDRMLHEDGAMVASFSAVDDQGIEGGHYLWRLQELGELLDDEELKLIESVWQIGRPLELEAGNHPRFFQTLAEYAKASEQPLAEVERRYAAAVGKLSTARDRRSLPVDDKLLAGWNGLALTAFAEAAARPGLQRYRATAETLKNFLIERLWNGETLTRARVKGKPFGSASLEDYAYVAQGMLAWARLTGDDSDYRATRQVVDQGWRRFFKDHGWYREDGTLLAPPTAVAVMADGAIRSPAATLIAVTLTLAERFDDDALRRQALTALNRGDELLRGAAFWYATQLGALREAAKNL